MTNPDAPAKIAVITLSAPGEAVAARIAGALPDCDLYVHAAVESAAACERFERVVDLTASIFVRYKGLVYVMPCGVVVRAIAPHIQDKLTDPAVVVLDVGARWVVSLLSGHEGGANDLALQIANLTGAEPVVSTTTEALKDLIVGVGCRRGAAAADIIGAVKTVLADNDLDPERVRYLASATIKAQEPGLLAAATELAMPLRLVAEDEIRTACRTDIETFDAPSRHVGLPGVAEPAALLAARRTELLVPRQIVNSVTVAVAQERFLWSE